MSFLLGRPARCYVSFGGCTIFTLEIMKQNDGETPPFWFFVVAASHSKWASHFKPPSFWWWISCFFFECPYVEKHMRKSSNWKNNTFQTLSVSVTISSDKSFRNQRFMSTLNIKQRLMKHKSFEVKVMIKNGTFNFQGVKQSRREMKVWRLMFKTFPPKKSGAFINLQLFWRLFFGRLKREDSLILKQVRGHENVSGWNHTVMKIDDNK